MAIRSARGLKYGRRLAGCSATLRRVYTGNVRDEEGSATRCHDCGVVLVGRDGYALTTWRLAPGGRCCECGAPCSGVFDAQPGAWGERRLPVLARRRRLAARVLDLRRSGNTAGGRGEVVGYGAYALTG